MSENVSGLHVASRPRLAGESLHLNVKEAMLRLPMMVLYLKTQIPSFNEYCLIHVRRQGIVVEQGMPVQRNTIPFFFQRACAIRA